MKKRDPIAYQLQERQFHQRIVRVTRREQIEEDRESADMQDYLDYLAGANTQEGTI